MLTIADVMTHDLVTIHPEAYMDEASQLLLEHAISGLPVVDDEGRLVGVISEYALLSMVYDNRSRCETVGQHMTRAVLTVDVEQSIEDVVDMCILHRVRRVPVINRGRLVGIISRRDMLRAFQEANTLVCPARC